MDDEKVKEIAQRVGITPVQAKQVLTELVKAGVVQYSPGFISEEFAAAKQTILRRDIYVAAREAREKSHRLFEDQGLVSIAVIFSNILADLIEHPEEMRELAR
jgi:DNA-binding IclR family transcriptional regulator